LVQANRNGLKLNDTHQLLAYADDVNWEEAYIKENTEALVATGNTAATD
jgi:hypothetical protein